MGCECVLLDWVVTVWIDDFSGIGRCNGCNRDSANQRMRVGWVWEISGAEGFGDLSSPLLQVRQGLNGMLNDSEELRNHVIHDIQNHHNCSN